MLGNRLRALREKYNLTQEDVSQQTGISTSAIGMYEQNRRKPDIEKTKLLANLYDVSIDYLADNQDDKDDEYKELYDSIYNNPDLKIFFNQTKDLTKDEMKWVLSIVEKVKDEHYKNS